MGDSLINPDETREWMDSFNDAKRHGTFHPANGYASSRDMTDDIYRIAAESPDRTVFRLAHDSHTNLIVKRRSNLVFIDAYSNRYITFGNGENDGRLLSMTLRRGEDPTYHGFVVIRPSAERARDLITGGNTVPTRRESSLENGRAVERRKYRKR